DDPVFVHVVSDWQLDRRACVAYSLKATVGRGMRAPASLAGHVELAIFGVKPQTVRTRDELTRHGHDRSLGLTIDLLAQHQEIGADSKRGVEKLTLQRAKATVGDRNLAAARIVQPVRDINER